MNIIQKVVKSGELLLSFYSSAHFCNILSLFIVVSIVVYPCLHCYLSLSPLLFPSPWRNVGATEWLFVLSSLSTTLLVFGLDSLDLCAPAQGCLLSLIVPIVESKLFSLLINIPTYGLDSLDLCAPAQGCLLSLIVSIVESKLFSLLINIPSYGLDSLDFCAPAQGCLLLSLSSLFTPSLLFSSVT